MMRQTTLWKTPYGINQEVYENDNSSFWVDRMEGDKLIEYVRSTIYADQAGTLYLDESDDEGTTSAVLASLSIAAGVTGKFPWTALTKRWYRFRYVNGATAQTKFRAIKEMAGEGEDVVNAKLTGCNVEEDGSVKTTLTTSLDKELDSVASYQAGHGTLFNGQKTVTAAGTQVQLGAQSCNRINIKALSGNTGLIYVGVSTVDSATGFELSAKEQITLDITDASMVWIDSSVNGEGVSYIGTYQAVV